MVVERYSHVMHIVSNVVGKLAEGKDAFDVLRASFPAGTVSGAPKVRAMEIIDEMEPVRRGPYSGAVGYFGFGGSMDTCIAIRTLYAREGKLYLQVGAASWRIQSPISNTRKPSTRPEAPSALWTWRGADFPRAENTT